MIVKGSVSPIVRLAATAAMACVAASRLGAWYFVGGPSDPVRWSPTTNPVMELQLGNAPRTLIDGSTSYDQVFEFALAEWDKYLSPLWDRAVETPLFYVNRNSTAPRATGNGRSNVFFSTTTYGASFPARAVAWTSRTWQRNENGFLERQEADVIFNSAYPWDSYRGPLRATGIDFYRIALHEAGHVLGLDHPDLNGQPGRVAQMNSEASDLDGLAADDIQGLNALYSVEPPGPPTNLRGSSTDSTVSVSWGPPVSGGVPTGYVITAGSTVFFAEANQLAEIHTGNPQTEWSSLPGVSQGTYYVRAYAVNWRGWSTPTSDVRVVVGADRCTPPATPTLTVIFNSGGTVTLAWTVPAGNPTTYVLQAGANSLLAGGAPDRYDADLNSAAATLTAPNVAAGTYYIRVTAKNACGTSAPSNEVKLVVAPVAPPPPPTPSSTTYSGTFVGNYTSVGRFSLGTCTWRFTYNGRQTMTLSQGSDGTLTGSTVHLTGTRFTGPGSSTSSSLRCDDGSFSVDEFIAITGTPSSLRWTSGNWTFAGSLAGNAVSGTMTISGTSSDGVYTFSGSIPNITLPKQ